MEFKKLFIGFLSITVLSSSAITAFANNMEDQIVATTPSLNTSLTEVYKEGPLNQSYFNSFSGTVKEITGSERTDGLKFVFVENENGQQATIVLSKDTYLLNNTKIELGSVITGYYNANAPMILIYPPQYSSEVVVVDSQDQNIKVDLFDKELVSADNTLKLNISKDTEIVSQDGSIFEGALADKKLVVIYDISTRSIPAQTTPKKVVVLSEIKVPDDLTQTISADVSTMDILVNNKKIQTPAAYTNEQGTVMLPLRAIVEALGFDVGWNAHSQSILIGKGISLSIGQDIYNYMKMAPIHLGTAPIVKEGNTFVPMSFFTEVMQINNADIVDSQIVITHVEIEQEIID